jgi:hypothetical protein
VAGDFVAALVQLRHRFGKEFRSFGIQANGRLNIGVVENTQEAPNPGSPPILRPGNAE